MRLDLTGYTQVRLIAKVVVAGFADYFGKDLGVSQRHEEHEVEQPRAARHEEPERDSEEPPLNLRYTLFVLRLLWVVVVVPFIAGAALAFVLNLPEGPSAPAQLPERTERTIPTTPPYSTTPVTTAEETTGHTTATATVSLSN